MIPGTTQAAFHQHISDHRFKAGGEISQRQGFSPSLKRLHAAQHRRLQTAEGEVVGVKPPSRKRDTPLRKSEAGSITGRGQLLDRWAAGVSETKQTSDLIEGFAGRIVMAAGQTVHGPCLFDPDQLGVSSTDKQHQIRGTRRLLTELNGCQMSLQVMDGEERAIVKG